MDMLPQFNSSNTLAAPHRPPQHGEGGCPIPTHKLSRLSGIVTTPYFCFLSRILLGYGSFIRLG